MKEKNAIIKILPFREEDRGTVYIEVPFEVGEFVPEVYAVKENTVII
jgi:hypothetical protein